MQSLNRLLAALGVALWLAAGAAGAQTSVVSIADATVTEGAAGNQTTISMTNPAGRFCQVAVTSSNGSAVAPGDYGAFTGGLFNLNGVASDVLGLSIVDDNDIEGNETFTIAIALTASSDPQCALGKSTATVTIVSDDIASVVSIADAVVNESAGLGQTTVSMTNPSGVSCQVAVTSSDGSAVAPGDYAAFTGGVFNLNGVASELLGLSIVDDNDIEGNETFTIAIALTASSDPRCVLGKSTATITIVSDDIASVVSIADAAVNESAGLGQTTISMTNPAGVSCQVAVTSSDASAVAPGDYAAFTGGVFNLNGVASEPLGLSIVDDSDVEGTQYFTLTIALTAAADPRCRLGKSTATILILDNDAPPDTTPPTVTIDQAAAQSDPTGSSPVLFTVVFNEPVIGFTAAEVDLNASTVVAALAPTVTGGPSTYTVSVAVTGATTGGSIVATIPAGAASDGVNNSLASTSTDNSVGYVVAAPAPVVARPIPTNDPVALWVAAIALALAAARRLPRR